MPDMRTKRAIEILEKRKDYLNRRIAEAERQGKNLSFDKSEVGALITALEAMRTNEARLNAVQTAQASIRFVLAKHNGPGPESATEREYQLKAALGWLDDAAADPH